MADIKLKNASGEDVTYSGVEVLQVTNTEGGTEEFVDKALLGDIPTKTSQLENDSGFITAADIPEGDGSSAPVSWNNITDKPFYESEPTLTEFLPATEISFTLDGDMYMTVGVATEELMAAWESDWNLAVVIWDGVEYVCQPQTVSGLKVIGNFGPLLGTGNSGEPFILGCGVEGTEAITMCYDVATIPAEGAADGDTITHTVRVHLIQTEIHTLDEKFVPELDYESKIKNKPFGTTTAGTLIAEGNVTCDTVFQSDSDGNPTSYFGTIEQIELVAGGVYQALLSQVVNGNIATMVATGTANSEGAMVMLELQYDSVTVGLFINGYVSDNTMIISNGATPQTFEYQLVAASEIIKKVDAKYLPDSLPAVTTSDNGKFLRVDNGTWAVVALSNAEEVIF